MLRGTSGRIDRHRIGMFLLASSALRGFCAGSPDPNLNNAKQPAKAKDAYLGTGPGLYGPGWVGFGWYRDPWFGVSLGNSAPVWRLPRSSRAWNWEPGSLGNRSSANYFERFSWIQGLIAPWPSNCFLLFVWRVYMEACCALDLSQIGMQDAARMIQTGIRRCSRQIQCNQCARRFSR